MKQQWEDRDIFLWINPSILLIRLNFPEPSTRNTIYWTSDDHIESISQDISESMLHKGNLNL
jgi:hypothetical protein